MSSIRAFAESLIGFNKDDTVNAYYERDINMGLNNMNTIIKALKKLGYYETNINSLEEAFIKSELTSQGRAINIVKFTYLKNTSNSLTDIFFNKLKYNFSFYK